MVPVEIWKNSSHSNIFIALNSLRMKAKYIGDRTIPDTHVVVWGWTLPKGEGGVGVTEGCHQLHVPLVDQLQRFRFSNTLRFLVFL